MWLLFAFIAVPLIEIGLFIQVGGWLGLWPTLLIVVSTALAGTMLVRSQGLRVLGDIQRSLDRLDDPTGPLAHGAMILLSGALLLTPGFFTDAIGFSLLVPGVRDIVFDALRKRIKVRGVATASARRGPAPHRGGPSGRPDVIDGDFEEIDPDSVPPRPGDRPSGWTR